MKLAKRLCGLVVLIIVFTGLVHGGQMETGYVDPCAPVPGQTETPPGCTPGESHESGLTPNATGKTDASSVFASQISFAEVTVGMLESMLPLFQ